MEFWRISTTVLMYYDETFGAQFLFKRAQNLFEIY